jgi:predicted transposase YbfD/YdcC
MGCQTEIAQKIVDKGADYCLAVKGNQRTLHQGIAKYFEEYLNDEFKQVKARHHTTHEKAHGREDSRWYVICPVPDKLPDLKRWPKLKAIGITFHQSRREGNECTEVRYYILSKYLPGKRFAAAVRQHWSIENELHWQLDVTFNEDQSRIRQRHADANFSILRRTALSMLKNQKTAKVGVKNKRLEAGWNTNYLEKVQTG